jgi:ATP-dependent DNA helicase RecG
LQALSDSALSSHEIAEVLGLESKSGSLKRTIKDLLENSLIEMTHPNKPNSRLQKYRLTEKGRRLKAGK